MIKAVTGGNIATLVLAEGDILYEGG